MRAVHVSLSKTVPPREHQQPPAPDTLLHCEQAEDIGYPEKSFYVRLALPGSWVLEEGEAHSPQVFSHTSACPISNPSGKNDQVFLAVTQGSSSRFPLASPSDGKGTRDPVSTKPYPNWATCLTWAQVKLLLLPNSLGHPSHHPYPLLSHQKKILSFCLAVFPTFRKHTDIIWDLPGMQWSGSGLGFRQTPKEAQTQ